MQKTFDVNTIMSDLDETLKQETHDAIGSRPSIGGTQRELDSRGYSGSFAPRSQNSSAIVPEAPDEDAINPSHYRRHPSGIECIEVTRHMNFNTGNAIKYIWRYLDKGDPVENLKKAQWYLDDEIRRLEGKR